MKIEMTKRDYLNEFAEGAMILEPNSFDKAIVGIVQRIDLGPVVCYSTEKIIEVLMEGGMDEEEAYEYFEFNILGAYMGEGTPMFVEMLPD
jgi:hypothetical protein